MFRLCCYVCCGLVVISQASPAFAQTEFKKALQKKYDFKTVSCFTCHLRKKEVSDDQQAAFKENAKAFRNEFGKAFEKHLKGKDVTKRLADVKELATDDPQRKKVREEVTKEFLEALKKLESEKSSSGETYGELLKNAELDGVKAK